MKHLYLVADCDFVAADSEKEAKEAWLSITEEILFEEEDLKIELVPDERQITIEFDGPPDPNKQVRTAADWAAREKYPEIVCSTEW